MRKKQPRNSIRVATYVVNGKKRYSIRYITKDGVPWEEIAETKNERDSIIKAYKVSSKGKVKVYREKR